MRSSSGIKRGLAATSVAALAVTGVPLAASATPVAEQVGTGNVVLYSQYNTGNEASTRNDGQNQTIRLAAGAGSDVTAVTFQYSLGGAFQTITTVSERNDDGLFTFEWTPAGLPDATVTLRAVGTTASGTQASDDRQAVELNDANDGQHTVNLTTASRLGVFQQPYGGEQGRQLVRIVGTTSATNGNVTLSRLDGTGTPQSAATAPVTAGDGATTGSFQGALDITGYRYSGNDGGPDQLVVGAERDTDDVEGYTLYRQAITTVTAQAEDNRVPSGEATTVTVTVTDQDGEPVVGARVQPSTDGATSQFTDVDGRARFEQDAGTTTYYYADASPATGYDANAGDKRSQDVAVGAYTPVPSSLHARSADGPVFDRDESSLGDISVQVTDQEGNPQAVALRPVNYYWRITPFDGSPATVRDPATGTRTSVTDQNGRAPIPFPTDQESGTYELFAELAASPSTGTGGIPSSKVLTVKAGEATIEYAEGSPEQAPAGTSEEVAGTYQLEDGTGLPSRTINLTFQRGTESGTGATEPDAGFQDGAATATATTRSVTTSAQGGFAVTVKDPAENPQPEERGGNIDAVPAGNTDGTRNNHGVDFLTSVAPAKVVIAEETPLSEQGKTPGRPVSSTVTVTNADGSPLANETVTLSTDNGFFTPYAENTGGLTPAQDPAAGEDAGRYQNSGKQITVRTDKDGVARFTLAIERDPGFDDDGDVLSTVTATVGGASDTEGVDWTSDNPYNGGQVLLEFSPAGQQQSGVLPKSPVSDKVLLDVFTEDQFGNLVGGETVNLEDNTGSADLSTRTVTTDFVADGDATATASDTVDQVVTARWTTETNKYATGTPPVVTPGTETLTDALTVSWYEVDYAASTFTLRHSGAETQRVGSTVTSTYTAVDQNGEPISDLFVQFFRTGPGDSGDGEGADASGLLGQDGKLEYVFQGGRAGTANISVVAREGSASGNTVPQAQRSDTVRFKGGTPVAISARLKGFNTGAGADKLTVKAPRAAQGAKVRLFRVTNGKRVLVKIGNLNERGKRSWVVRDRNGGAKTKYVAVVGKTERTRGDRTNNLRLR